MVKGRSCAGNTGSTGPIAGCEGRTSGFSTVNGRSCAGNTGGTTSAAIPGCEGRTTGFSTVNGQSCVGNTGGTTVTPAGKRFYNMGTVTLRSGSSGEAVKELQRFLNDTLNLGLVVDGKLGPKTIAVIVIWQRNNGLVADGLIGNKTKAKMNGF